MEVFVESRGHSPDFDYCWQPEVPPQLSSISSFIQSESPSVVLARLQGRLILLTTGLESPVKKDFRDRPIRHSVCWICSDNKYDEKQIRAIAVQALKGLLSDQVDRHINLGGEKGFEISFPELQNLSEPFLNEIKHQCLPESEKLPKIGRNSQDLRDDLADKLQQYILPEGYKLIVIATGIKPEDTLGKARAWRSLSNLVKSEKNWRDLSRNGVQQQPNFTHAAIAITVTVIAVVALILLVFLRHPFAPTPEVTPSPPQETSQSQPEVRTNPEQVEQEQNPFRDLTSLENDLQKDSTPSVK